NRLLDPGTLHDRIINSAPAVADGCRSSHRSEPAASRTPRRTSPAKGSGAGTGDTASRRAPRSRADGSWRNAPKIALIQLVVNNGVDNTCGLTHCLLFILHAKSCTSGPRG